MDDRERLRALLVERSVRLGDFTLSSGARSSYYVDARPTTMSAEGQFLIGKLGWELVRDRAALATHVGGPTMGADPVAFAIAHRSWLEGRRLDAFSVRKHAKGHGLNQLVEGGLPEGAQCVVVEDSMTTEVPLSKRSPPFGHEGRRSLPCLQSSTGKKAAPQNLQGPTSRPSRSSRAWNC